MTIKQAFDEVDEAMTHILALNSYVVSLSNDHGDHGEHSYQTNLLLKPHVEKLLEKINEFMSFVETMETCKNGIEALFMKIDSSIKNVASIKAFSKILSKIDDSYLLVESQAEKTIDTLKESKNEVLTISNRF